MSSTIKIASINIRGIRAIQRRQILLQFCLDGGFDVIGLPEVTFNECTILERHFDFISNLGPKRLGTAVLIRKGVSHSRELLDPDGRLISIDVGSFTFINVYAPSGRSAKEERNLFLRQTFPAYALTSKFPFVLIGDFNCVDNIEDRSEINSKTNPAKRTDFSLIDMVEGLETIDIWKKLKPSEKVHTFFHPSGSSRIDRIFFHEILCQQPSRNKYQPSII